MIDLAGRKFSHLLVLRRNGSIRTSVAWLCRCDCGIEKTIIGTKLTLGRALSCGCMQHKGTSERMKTHGGTSTRLFRIWTGMKTRCHNPKSSGWARYGSKGITVCDEWRDSFQTFAAWAPGAGYSENLSIDRIDNGKGYSPDNCRWATESEQALNTSRGRVADGRRVADVAAEHGINIHTVKARIKDGWDPLLAATTPPLKPRTIPPRQAMPAAR